MWLAIVLFFVAAVLFAIVGVFFANDNVGGGLISLFIGGIVTVVGMTTLYTSAQGRICSPSDMPDQIYTNLGQIETPNEAVAIISNSKGELFAVWTRQQSDKSSSLAKTARFVQLVIIDGKTRLVEVPVESGATVTIPNPLLPAAEKTGPAG